MDARGQKSNQTKGKICHWNTVLCALWGLLPLRFSSRNWRNTHHRYCGNCLCWARGWSRWPPKTSNSKYCEQQLNVWCSHFFLLHCLRQKLKHLPNALSELETTPYLQKNTCHTWSYPTNFKPWIASGVSIKEIICIWKRAIGFLMKKLEKVHLFYNTTVNDSPSVFFFSCFVKTL